MIIGITGCPGAGKSLLTAAVASHGGKVVDADVLGREVVESDPVLLVRLAEAFGGDIIGSGGGLDRRILASRAFADPAATRRLNGIVHPVLIARLEAMIEEFRSRGERAVVDCALIFEWGIEGRFDLVVAVHADREQSIRRIMERDGRSREDVLGMFAAQLSPEEKVMRADVAVANNGSAERMAAFGAMLVWYAAER